MCENEPKEVINADMARHYDGIINAIKNAKICKKLIANNYKQWDFFRDTENAPILETLMILQEVWDRDVRKCVTKKYGFSHH